jgi:hypothetical protein
VEEITTISSFCLKPAAMEARAAVSATARLDRDLTEACWIERTKVSFT